MPQISDLVWLRESKVPDIFNALAESLLKSKPRDVYGHIAEWGQRQAWEHLCCEKAAENTTNPISCVPAAPPPPQMHDNCIRQAHEDSVVLSREASAILHQTFGTNGAPFATATNPYNTEPTQAIDTMFAGLTSTPPSELPPEVAPISRTNSSRRLSRAASLDHTGGNTTPLLASDQAYVQHAYRPSPQDLLQRYSTPEGKYELHRCIGEGHYGKVYRAVRLSDGVPAAVKKVTIDGDWVEQEIQHLVHCQSEHCARLLAAHYSPSEDTLWIVMELLSVSLANIAEALGPKSFDERMIAVVTREVAKGLEVLHQLQRVHLDVKPANILFSSDRQSVKIADFGTMQPVGDACIQLGDFAFMSPEVAYSSGHYHAGSDMWSLGITMLYLADGEAPLWREKPDMLMFLHRETCMVCAFVGTLLEVV